MLKRFARAVVAQRHLVVAVTAISFAYFAWKAMAIGFVMTPEIWFRPTDPARIAYDKLHDYFGDDEFVIAVIEDKERGVFHNSAIEAIERLTREIEEAPYVNKIQSLTEFEWIHGSKDALIVDGLLRDAIDEGGFPLKKDTIQHAKEVILADELAVSLLTNKAGTSAAIVGRVERVSDTFAHKIELSEHLIKVFDKEEATSGYHVYYAGSPIIDYAFFQYSLRDNQVLMPALYGLIFIVLFLVFRRLSGVFYPLVVVIYSSVAVVGMIVIIGSAIQTMTSMLPMLLIAVCIADSIHVVLNFYDRLRETRDRLEAARQTVEDMFVPCFLTSLTTCIGFASITTSDMPPVNEYGALAAYGVAVAFVISIVSLPAVLTYGKLPADIRDATKPHKGHPGEEGYNDRTLKVLQALDRFVRKWPKAILVGTFALLGLALWGASNIRTETVAIEFFPKSSPIRKNTYAIEDQLGGSANIEIVLDSGEDDGVKDPEFLLKVRDIQNYLDTIPEVAKSTSVVDYVERLNRSLHAEREDFERIPVQADFQPGGAEMRYRDEVLTEEEKELAGTEEVSAKDYIAQILLLYTIQDPKEDLTDIVDYPFRHARITARVPFMGQNRSVEITDGIENYIQTNYPELTHGVTGLIVLYNNMGYYVNRTLQNSFIMAVLVITIIIGIALRSAKWALLSVIPNVFPVIWVLGIMGLVGIALDVGTVLVAGITIGIAVDDCIHFLSRYVQARRRGESAHDSIQYVMRHSGRAIVFTSVILMGGFWMLVFAHFKPIAYLGLISGLTIAFALLADLITLPAILYLVDGKNGESAGDAPTSAS